MDAAKRDELMEARDEKRLMRMQRQLAKVKLLIIDELGFVPLSKTGAEILLKTGAVKRKSASQPKFFFAVDSGKKI